MGYYIRPGLVEENIELLDKIVNHLGNSGSIAFDAGSGGLVDRLYWRLMRIIKATETLVDEAEGRFASLRKHIKVKRCFDPPSVIIEMDETKDLSATPLLTDDETVALARISSYNGRVLPLDFTPSSLFDEDKFRQDVRDLGFSLTRTDEGTYIAHRPETPRKSAFDIITGTDG